MIAWLYNLIVGQCFGHDWEEYGTGTIAGRDPNRISGHYSLAKCSKCGKLKKYEA